MTEGHGDVGTDGHGDVGDPEMQGGGWEAMGTEGRGDVGTDGHGDRGNGRTWGGGTDGHGDRRTRRRTARLPQGVHDQDPPHAGQRVDNNAHFALRPPGGAEQRAALRVRPEERVLWGGGGTAGGGQ